MKLCPKCGAQSDESSRFCIECGTSLTSEDPIVGRVFGGSFVVRELIGVGGMGRVYRAEQNTLGRTVAIKLIHPHLHGDEQTVQRFYTEARAASRLNHPNSVGVIDFGRSEDGILYLVLEFLEGDDLSNVLGREGPLPMDRSVSILGQVLDALEEAHHFDIVHRDLKPENVFILKARSGSKERVKVLDFGLATVVGVGSSVTRPGLVCGTPAYMSPEQARGKAVDARSDLYSIGALLYELLTDHPPFTADTPVKLLMKHVNDPVPDPRKDAPSRAISGAMAEVAMKALAKDPDHRYQSAAEMKQALFKAQSSQVGSGARVERPRACASCGELNEPSMRYCGSCGARLRGSSVTSSRRSQAMASVDPESMPFVGRDAILASLDGARKGAAAALRLVHVDGEAGSGRTRLFAELLGRANEDGDFVVRAGRHDSGLPVAYAMARSVAASLLEVGADGPLLTALVDLKLGPIVRAGFEELESPSGLRGVDGVPKAAAVGAALAFLVRRAIEKSSSGRVTLLLDDVERVDDLSRRALGLAMRELAEEAVFVATTAALPQSQGAVVRLPPLGLEAARAALSQPAGEPDPAFTILPRTMAQLAALGESIEDYRNGRPRSPADLAMSRLDRVDIQAKRTLQTLAVLGFRAKVSVLKQLASQPLDETVGELVARGLLALSGDTVGFTEPFLAELIAMDTPSEVRRQLYSAALEVGLGEGWASDVIAEHAAHAADGMRSLLFLERGGDQAVRRGDVKAGLSHFRRGAELARNEALVTGEPMFDAARVSFTRKFCDVMVLDGAYVTADGMLREILDLTESDRGARARILLSIAQVSRLRGRTDEATHKLVACLELVAGTMPDVEALVQFELGELRMQLAQHDKAIVAFRRCIEILSPRASDAVQVAKAYARLADVAVALGETEAVMPSLMQVVEEAKKANAPAVAARALVRCAPFTADRGEWSLEQALSLAASAGDAETFRAVAEARGH